MDFYKLVIGTMIFIPALWLSKRMIFKIRFDRLKAVYVAKWNCRPREERENIVLAFDGYIMRDQGEDLERDKDDPHFSVLADSALENGDRLKIRNKDIRKATDPELKRLLGSRIDEHWEAMKAAGDYDFIGTIEELDYVFNNSAHLSRYLD